MKNYEHKILEVNPEGLRFQIKGLGPTWRFVGTVEPNSTVWVREVPAPGLGAILSEVSTQLHILSSEVVAGPQMTTLARLADCVDAIAKGQSVTVEDVIGKPLS
jgi:hypothetical protein